MKLILHIVKRFESQKISVTLTLCSQFTSILVEFSAVKYCYGSCVLIKKHIALKISDKHQKSKKTNQRKIQTLIQLAGRAIHHRNALQHAHQCNTKWWSWVMLAIMWNKLLEVKQENIYYTLLSRSHLSNFRVLLYKLVLPSFSISCIHPDPLFLFCSDVCGWTMAILWEAG